jgi:hypothetical protein
MKEVKKVFASAYKAAGLKYGLYEYDGLTCLTFHTLRHRFNSILESDAMIAIKKKAEIAYIESYQPRDD